MIDPNELRTLAALTIVGEQLTEQYTARKKQIDKEIAARKVAIRDAVGRGSVTAYAAPGDPTSEPLGLIKVAKPRQPVPKIIDEEQVIVWLLENFADDETMIDQRPRLSAAGKASAIAAAKSGAEIPGIVTPELGDPVVSFTQTDEARDEINAMIARGEIILTDVLKIEAP
ncbi:hypothetical protein [Gordonia sp. MMO-8]|uniref:hypothetical protein n=1 Tax=Gordonia sp. MMO-8 TaxID=3127886 RepID=UPI0030174520